MIKATITKDEIATLEKVDYTGNIYVINSVSQAKVAITHLNKFKIVGFDTETRPSFKKGELRNMALMQISTLDECFLFRINIIGLPEVLREFLENKDIIKVGISLKDDFGVLNRSFGNMKPNGFIDLQKVVEDYEIIDKSLQKIYAILFNQKISKSQRLSNWEAPTLSDAQQEYAAIDAWACLKIYNYIKSGKFNPELSKYYIDIIDPTTNLENTDKNEKI